VGDDDPDVKSLAARVARAEQQRAEAVQASADEAKQREERHKKPQSVSKAERKHYKAKTNRERAQAKVAQKRKVLEAAQADLDTAMGQLLEWEEKVLVAEAVLRTAIHQADAELDGRNSIPDVQVVTSTLETQMSNLLHTMSQTAETLLAPGTDGTALRLQLQKWVQEIGELPLQAKVAVKQEPKDSVAPGSTAGAAASSAAASAEGVPPAKQRRLAARAAAVHSTDDERGYLSAGSLTEVHSSGDEEIEPGKLGKLRQETNKAKENEPAEERDRRSRSPPQHR
jgi:hypothetical protein